MDARALEALLRDRVAAAEHGERLPTVRTMMREYRVGQATIQAALARLARQGLLQLQVGRGTFVQRPVPRARAGFDGARVLLLSPRRQTERSYAVARRLQAEFAARGARCVQIIYERIDEALGLLDPDRRFDACVLQSYFDPLPLRLIAFLRERTGALCVDGARLAGVDVDAVASDWRGAIDLAMERLRAAGHQRIGLVAWPGAVPPLQGVRQHFASLRRCLDGSPQTMPTVELESAPQPGHAVRAEMAAALKRIVMPRAGGPTALLIWGGGAHAGELRHALKTAGRGPRSASSVLLLCHVDRPEEHGDHFACAGSVSAQAADEIVGLIAWRFEHPAAEPRTVLLPSRFDGRASLDRVRLGAPG